jgi:16S rRNA (adenine1518-N6/adenine1519-N6)-dimethyltransferase
MMTNDQPARKPRRRADSTAPRESPTSPVQPDGESRPGRPRPGPPTQRPPHTRLRDLTPERTRTQEIRQTLRDHGLRARKGFGQNFLRDTRYLERIIKAADLAPTDTIIEVGPGLGALTLELAPRVRQVIAVEKDVGVVAALGEAVAAHPNVRIVTADIMECDPAQLAGGQPYKLVANLPYYITSSIVRLFLELSSRRPTLCVVMMQREVAERMIAPPGDMSLLAVGVQFYGKPRIVAMVPAQAFYPTPKVDSAIVRIEVFERPRLDVEPARFFKMVQAGFSQPRKQLHNALAQRIWLPPGRAPELLEAAGIDAKRRAQTLTLEEWGALYAQLVADGWL